MSTKRALLHFIDLMEPAEPGEQFYLSHGATWDEKDIRIPLLCLTIFANEIIIPEGTQAPADPEEMHLRLRAYRHVKKIVGPFEAKGKPPSIELGSKWKYRSALLSYDVATYVHGVYTCRIVAEKEVPLTDKERAENARRAAGHEKEADSLRTALSTVEKQWTCEANIPLGKL